MSVSSICSVCPLAHSVVVLVCGLWQQHIIWPSPSWRLLTRQVSVHQSQTSAIPQIQSHSRAATGHCGAHLVQTFALPTHTHTSFPKTAPGASPLRSHCALPCRLSGQVVADCLEAGEQATHQEEWGRPTPGKVPLLWEDWTHGLGVSSSQSCSLLWHARHASAG